MYCYSLCWCTGRGKGELHLLWRRDRGSSAHYFVGIDSEIWQCVEDQNIAWHCGASSYKHPECRSANSIGIEMCVRKRGTQTLGATDRDWYF
ncbi:N-acetylmuramoyl-L-alanine amidase [Ruminococcus sp. MCC718]|uniref:N-acetylmuramoyl-L-alanine amidase n=1 Tax=Ruminococcus sp. MCC718 TaxID=2592649 RepID=UPI003211C85F